MHGGGVEFDVSLLALPAGATLRTQYGRSSQDFDAGGGTSFELAMSTVGLQDQENDVAFAVNIEKSGLDNTQLGTNRVTMTVSLTWYESRLAAGKQVLITKVAESGDVYSVPADCEVDGAWVRCTARFDGEAGGFSLFLVLAKAAVVPVAEDNPVVASPTAAISPSPTPSAMPTASPTPTPTSSSQTSFGPELDAQGGEATGGQSPQGDAVPQPDGGASLWPWLLIVGAMLPVAFGAIAAAWTMGRRKITPQG